jgi:hypothetical protein
VEDRREDLRDRVRFWAEVGLGVDLQCECVLCILFIIVLTARLTINTRAFLVFCQSACV